MKRLTKVLRRTKDDRESRKGSPALTGYSVVGSKRELAGGRVKVRERRVREGEALAPSGERNGFTTCAILLVWHARANLNS